MPGAAANAVAKMAERTMKSSSGIDLTLSRMKNLYNPAQQSWKAIHVAGTNGKGSICHYITAMLRSEQRFSVGQFTSPHLRSPWDSTRIDGQLMPEEKYVSYIDRLRLNGVKHGDGPTNFECQTLAAFQWFNDRNVDFGVIEVGLGGDKDATNVVGKKVVTVISKIGLDHTKYLGNTFEDIARAKAGIMVADVPCVSDGSNDPRVLDVLRAHAGRLETELLLTSDVPTLLDRLSQEKGLAQYQVQNMACAILAFKKALPASPKSVDELISIAREVVIPGRLQWLNVSRVHQERKAPILLDGAHNAQGTEALGQYVDTHLRAKGECVTWVICMSEDREPTELLLPLVKKSDRLAVVKFGKVIDMPWVKSRNPADIRRYGQELGLSEESIYHGNTTHQEAIEWAVNVAGEGPVVVAGSVYGVAIVLQSYYYGSATNPKDGEDTSEEGYSKGK